MFSTAFQHFFCALYNISPGFWAFSFAPFYFPSFSSAFPLSLSSFLPFLLPLLLSGFLSPFYLELPVLIKWIYFGPRSSTRRIQILCQGIDFNTLQHTYFGHSSWNNQSDTRITVDAQVSCMLWTTAPSGVTSEKWSTRLSILLVKQSFHGHLQCS